MTAQERPETVWGIGLIATNEADIAQALGSGYVLRNFSSDIPPKSRDLAKDAPLAAFVAREAWEALPRRTKNLIAEWDIPQRVLVLEADHAPEDFQEAMDAGFLTAMPAPLSPKRVRDVIFKAKEVKSLSDDIFRMTREIMLERELLARKTALVLFLNQILTRATESLDAPVILGHARQDLEILLPITALAAITWHAPDTSGLVADIYLEPDLSDQEEEAWIEHLLAKAAAHAARSVGDYRLTYISDKVEGLERPAAPLVPERLIVLPLRAGGQVFGCLAIERGPGRALGKDQVQALHAAVNHLALALRNAAMFTEVKSRADHDGLTRIHNRRAFDEKLVEELKRHQRYGHNLSLLMLDLDHFKQINDTHGHQAGDAVLRDVGRVLFESLRATDFAARYGGEEFVVLLPQTGEEQAWTLAERLRRKIAARSFAWDETTFQVTTSIGVATVKPGSLKRRADLIRQADAALYQAKAGGRNMVCVLEPEVGKQKKQAMRA